MPRQVGKDRTVVQLCPIHEDSCVSIRIQEPRAGRLICKRTFEPIGRHEAYMPFFDWKVWAVRNVLPGIPDDSRVPMITLMDPQGEWHDEPNQPI